IREDPDIFGREVEDRGRDQSSDVVLLGLGPCVEALEARHEAVPAAVGGGAVDDIAVSVSRDGEIFQRERAAILRLREGTGRDPPEPLRQGTRLLFGGRLFAARGFLRERGRARARGVVAGERRAVAAGRLAARARRTERGRRGTGGGGEPGVLGGAGRFLTAGRLVARAGALVFHACSRRGGGRAVGGFVGGALREETRRETESHEGEKNVQMTHEDPIGGK